MKVWRLDNGISKEDWLSVLTDGSVVQEQDWPVLKLIYESGNAGICGKKLAEELQMTSHAPLNRQMPALAKRVCAFLNVPPIIWDDGSPGWWHVLFWSEERKEGLPWIMRPELRSAIEMLLEEDPGFRQHFLDANRGEDELDSADEAREADSISMKEGTRSRITRQTWRRNRIAREKYIEHYSSACQICGFDFGSTYGSEFVGEIHIHHIRPLHEIGGEYEVNPIEDLIPVCPNCHFALHSRTPECYAPDELRKKLQSAG